MSSESGVKRARSDRVWVGMGRAEDVGPHRLAVEQSRQRLPRWNPVDPEDLERGLALQPRDHRTFLTSARGRKVVVEGYCRPEDARFVVQGLRRCGLEPATTPEVWCLPAQVHAAARPLGLGPSFVLDTSEDLSRGEVVRIALQVLAAGPLPLSET